MSDHTPTPWLAHNSGNADIWYLDRDPDDMGMIATVWGCDDRAEGNAKLIAKSVNEFAALQAEIERLRTHNADLLTASRLETSANAELKREREGLKAAFNLKCSELANAQSQLVKCAEIADEFAKHERDIFESAETNKSLSETGRQRVQDRSLARMTASEAIAKKIRALTQTDEIQEKSNG